MGSDSVDEEQLRQIREQQEVKLNGPRRDKTCLRGFRQSETQTSLLSIRD